MNEYYGELWLKSKDTYVFLPSPEYEFHKSLLVKAHSAQAALDTMEMVNRETYKKGFYVQIRNLHKV